MTKITEFPDNEKWIGRKITPWHQDTEPWEDEETGEIWPPTFAWMCQIIGQRRKDKVNFYNNVRMSGEEGKPFDVKIAQLHMERAIDQFEEYANCECVVGKACTRHGR